MLVLSLSGPNLETHAWPLRLPHRQQSERTCSCYREWGGVARFETRNVIFQGCISILGLAVTRAPPEA